MPVSMNGNISQTVQLKKVSTPVQKSENKEKGSMSTGTKIAIGTGLVALATLGVYIATRGKVKPKATLPAITNNPVQEIKELAVNTFKEAGNKFVKGKAVMADGTNYTGKIVSEGKDGSKVVMEYLDGVLQKSTKTKGTETIFEKTYKYSDELGLVNVTKNGNSVFNKTYDKATKQISINDGRVIIDTDTGIVIKGRLYIDKETGLTGNVNNIKVVTSVNGEPNYTIKINGKSLPEAHDNSQSNIDPNKAFVSQRASSHFDSLGQEGIDLYTYYQFDNTGKYSEYYKISGGYRQYDNLTYNSASGIIKNGEEQLFKYNPRSKEITESTIDNELAQQIVEHGEKHFKFLKKATKAWSNSHP